MTDYEQRTCTYIRDRDSLLLFVVLSDSSGDDACIYNITQHTYYTHSEGHLKCISSLHRWILRCSNTRSELYMNLGLVAYVKLLVLVNNHFNNVVLT